MEKCCIVFVADTHLCDDWFCLGFFLAFVFFLMHQG